MEIIFNTSNPIIILIYTILISGIIFFSRKTEQTILPVMLIGYMLILLIFHSIGNNNVKFVSIAFDLIFLFLSFISFLWIDDINSKKKKVKSYDNSLSWFWDEL